MHYAVGVAVYLFFYLLLIVYPLLIDIAFGAPGSGFPLLRALLVSVPVFLVGPRVVRRLADKEPLIPDGFRNGSYVFRSVGNFFVLIGHLAFFGSIGFAVYVASIGAVGVPVGFVAGLAPFPYALGITLVEIGYRQWRSDQKLEKLTSYVKPVWITIGVLLALNFVIGLFGMSSSGRPVDLLSYDERRALARSNGYAREVQKKAQAFYEAERRLPCINDKYIDVESLVGPPPAEFDIEIMDCGRFTITVESVDGVRRKPLLWLASETDTDILEWRCYSGHHERIERHTNGGCVYDASLAESL